ncbi:MAG: hypothetical protein PHO41_00415 [Eubacteriales bacterium]|nr:hypothetical protein [Eubacteriales bacterium]
MEQKTNALKTSSKVIAVIMKIGYIAMIVAMCICAASLIFMAVTGGQTSIDTAGGMTIGVADGVSTTPAELIAMFAEYLVISALLFVIFLLAQRMFGEISVTGDPFVEKYAKSVRVIGILVAAMTFVVGIMDTIVSSFVATAGIEAYTEAPGIVFGAVIFCLSYIIDYGCGLKEQSASK